MFGVRRLVITAEPWGGWRGQGGGVTAPSQFNWERREGTRKNFCSGSAPVLLFYFYNHMTDLEEPGRSRRRPLGPPGSHLPAESTNTGVRATCTLQEA